MRARIPYLARLAQHDAGPAALRPPRQLFAGEPLTRALPARRDEPASRPAGPADAAYQPASQGIMPSPGAGTGGDQARGARPGVTGPAAGTAPASGGTARGGAAADAGGPAVPAGPVAGPARLPPLAPPAGVAPMAGASGAAAPPAPDLAAQPAPQPPLAAPDPRDPRPAAPHPPLSRPAAARPAAARPAADAGSAAVPADPERLDHPAAPRRPPGPPAGPPAVTVTSPTTPPTGPAPRPAMPVRPGTPEALADTGPTRPPASAEPVPAWGTPVELPRPAGSRASPPGAPDAADGTGRSPRSAPVQLRPSPGPASGPIEQSGLRPAGARQLIGAARPRVSIGTIEVTVVPPARPERPADVQPPVRAAGGRSGEGVRPAASAGSDRIRSGLRRWYGTAQG